MYKLGAMNKTALSRITTINPVTLSLANQDYIALKYEIYCQYIRMKPVLNSDFIKIKGDLFEATEDFTLRHGVSTDFKISLEIALEFRWRF